MNELPPTPDALDRRIDEALQRCFAVPPGLETLAARSRPRRRRSAAPWIALAAAAAALIAVLAWNDGRRADRVRSPDELARRGPSPHAPRTPAATFCRLIGPVLDGEPEPGSMHRADLARLYREMDECQRESSAACGEEDFLAERLSATYGQPLALRPEAAGLLHGPFGSDEWPTGTIVTGTTDDVTSVLVADRDSTLACCLRMNLPPGSGLRLFTWQVGEVVLTEITPHEEPHLLAYFE